MRNYWTYAVFGVLIILLFLTLGYESGYGGAPCQYWGGMMHRGGMGTMHGPVIGGYGFGGFGLLFWILVVVFVVLLLRGREFKETRETPVDILNKRLVKGEITREEYLQMKEDILKQP